MKKLLVLIPALMLTLGTTHGETTGEFKNATELGIVIQSGNADVQNFAAKTLFDYIQGKNKYSLRGEYYNGKVSGAVASESTLLELKYDRLLTERLGFFMAARYEHDRFRGFEERWELEPGLKYVFLDGEVYKLFTEQGYTYRNESAYLPGPGTGPSSDFHFWRAYLEGSAILTDSISGKIWIKNLLNLQNSSDYEFSFEPSLDILLANNFTLALSYRGIYDNVPVGLAKKYDSIYMTTLKVKF